MAKKTLGQLEFDRFYITEGLWVTYNHSGKMSGTPDISTPATINPICKKRMENGDSICKKCYANTLLKCRKSLLAHLESNFEILNSKQLSKLDWAGLIIDPKEYPQFRIESFGDLASVTQAENYINLCLTHPDIRFGWWTKNIHFVEEACGELGYNKLPSNISLVKSSERLNEVSIPKNEFETENVKAVFTVYTLDWLLAALDGDVSKISQFINCAGRNCKRCGKCYNPNHKDIIYINEILKRDQPRARKLGIDCGEEE